MDYEILRDAAIAADHALFNDFLVNLVVRPHGVEVQISKADGEDPRIGKTLFLWADIAAAKSNIISEYIAEELSWAWYNGKYS
jgi:hypothetical protein